MKKIIILFLLSFLVLNNAFIPSSQAKSQGTKKKINQSIKEIKIKAAIIKESGDVIPCAKILIILLPYNRENLEAEFEKKNNAPAKPSYDDKKHYEEWEKVAHKGLEERISKIINDRKLSNYRIISAKTNLKGEAIIKIPKGEWFFNAVWRSNVFWSWVKIDIDDDLKEFELSNDNATNIFN